MSEQEETLLVTPAAWPYICGTPRHQALQLWLTDHDIDPNSVSVHDPVSIVTAPDGSQTIHYTAFLTNASGHRYIDPSTPNEAAREKCTAPLRTPPPAPKHSDITTLALLAAIDDHQKAFDASTGWARIELPTPWRTLCTVYPEKVVDAAYAREADCGHLDYGTCACLTKCDLCRSNGVPTRLTVEGLARLTELKEST